MGRTYWRAVARPVRGIARRLVLCYLAAACTTYRPIRSVPGPHEVSADEYNWARVLRHDNSVVKLRRARIQHDTISGNVPIGRAWHRIGVPLSDVARIESRQFDPVRTSLFAVGLVVAFQLGVRLAWALWGGGCANSSRSDVRCS